MTRPTGAAASSAPASLAVDVAGLGVAAARAGTVYLVGAGPGDPGLLTVRAAALLASCDLVAYDRLTPPEALDLVAAHAERICVGRRAGAPGWAQDDIHRLLVVAARADRAVVRLKGGDPFVLGRGGEELLACRAAGVPVEIVSGVTSAVAAPAAVGVPVTHRGVASAFAVVTGHEHPTTDGGDVDWTAVARFPGTLVMLMALTNLGDIAATLIANGKPPSTPVTLVWNATTREQEVLDSSLLDVADDVEQTHYTGPATIVVGDVAGVRGVAADGQTTDRSAIATTPATSV